MLMLLCLVRGFRMAWLLESRFLVFVGRHSYGIYLFHLPILFLFLYGTHYLSLTDTPLKKLVLDVPLFMLYVALVCLVAYIAFNYFESYFLRLKNRIKFDGNVHSSTPSG
jgi:peptidoglycan/LPS O-acetylase OafA/YrhL